MVQSLQRISLTTNTNGRNYFFHDGLGSTSELMNSAGTAAVSSYEYDVFGGLRSSNPRGNLWRFTGEQFDTSTGQYYLRARHYNQATRSVPYKGPVAGKPALASDYEPIFVCA
ncbi:MAG: hypothetical protein WEB00_08825 [Dehalococcoidia bacterium]